ncbi:RNA polymerase sigma factor [Agrobacterium rosae]|uniref:RNA polymerase sigma factor n=1 Tax=Agrobacterium rosae TaxID=1972867 RepID=UPI0019D3221D|nr:RNA polymerase sigma factor [Agrobacterium rosae]MBN7808380.1 RNA polymerase sigma factor [Agrobacterium rosae]
MSADPAQNTSLEPADGKLLLDTSIEDFYKDVVQAVRRRGLDASSSNDVIHDLYVKLANKPDVLRQKRSIKAFLIRSAVNLGFDRMKRAAFERRLFAQLDRIALAVPATNPYSQYGPDLRKRLCVLRKAILSLPPVRRRVFIAHRVGGMSRDEIAAALRITRGSVDRHLHHALLICVEELDQFE